METRTNPLTDLDLSSQTTQLKSLERNATPGDQVQDLTKMLVSVSSTVANSIGIDLSYHRLTFSLDEGAGEARINVISNRTGEIIRQICPDEVMKIRESAEEM